jgi:hypothetical protein
MLSVTLFSPIYVGLLSLPLCLALGLILFLFMEFGHRLGCKHRSVDPESNKDWVSVVDGPILALLGLLVAFTFSAAADRFNARRKLIVEEANAVGTAYLRLDLLNPPDRDTLRQKFRDYLDSRIKTYALIPDVQAALQEFEHSQTLQRDIWNQAIPACQKTGSTLAGMQLVPALNAMFDITITRFAATQFHTPVVVFILLISLALVAALLAGYQMSSSKKRCWIHVSLFVITFTLAIYVIMDLESPRLGLVRMDATDALLKDVRQSMTP